MMHLADADKQAVLEILRQHLQGVEVWAFGSRVSGHNLREFSDLDLAVICDAPLAMALYADLKEAFTESDLPMRVDVVDWASIDPAFRQIIRQNHEVIYP